MLEIAGINQYYGESHILRDVQITVAPGSCTCLMGRNGVGKTTLLKTIMGILKMRTARSASVTNELQTRGPEQRAHLASAYVPQGREIFSDLTVEENLMVASKPATTRAKKASSACSPVFPTLKKILETSRRRFVRLANSSRLPLARARAFTERSSFLDEPTEGIQPNVVHDIGMCSSPPEPRREAHDPGRRAEACLSHVGRYDYCIMDLGRAVSAGAMSAMTDDLGTSTCRVGPASPHDPATRTRRARLVHAGTGPSMGDDVGECAELSSKKLLHEVFGVRVIATTCRGNSFIQA